MPGEMEVWAWSMWLPRTMVYARDLAALTEPGQKFHIWLHNGLWHVGLRRR
jgi:hypothetical protein